MKIVSILIVLALIFVAVLPLISNAAPACDKEECPSCLTVSGTPLSVTAITQTPLYKQCDLTLSGVYHIFNIKFKPSLITFQIEHPPRA